MYNFKGKTVFITGAPPKGRGQGCRPRFAKEGANIIGFDLGERIRIPATTTPARRIS